MSVVIKFLSWIYNLVSKAIEWAIEVPSKLVIFVVTFVSVVTSAVGYISVHITDVVDLFNSATSKVGQVGGAMSQHQVGSLFAYATSLDVAAEYVSLTAGLFVGLVGIIFVSLFCYVVTAWVVPMSLLVAQKTISLFTGGFVKT